MNAIRRLFATERDPTRPLNEIVNAEQGLDVRSELDEYVFTQHAAAYLRVLVDALLDTSQGQTPDALRGWISGFFGSGKSHFLKLAAALLENRVLDVNGSTIAAWEYLERRHSIKVPWQRLASEFKVRSVTVNLALALGGGLQAQRSPLLYRLASEINRAWGFSRVPHVAVLEREIRRVRKWDQFVEAVRERNAKEGDTDEQGVPFEWTDAKIRDLAAEAHRVLEDVLPQVLPKYAKPRDYLRDKEVEQPSPESVVELAMEFARELHPELGRVLLCVDEIALYLKGSATTFDGDRVREVQGLAELVKDQGRGRVFLFATAQLRVDAIDAKLGDLQGSVMFLKDRFPSGGRLVLEETDIDLVVRERWLKKDVESPHYAALQARVRKDGLLLANAARLRDVQVLRETDALTREEAVIACYPFLPHHTRLLQEILSALRREEQVGQATAQSRALLTAVRAMFLTENGGRLADAEIGCLATFDRVYDVIRDVVRKADPNTDRWISEVIDGFEPCRTIRPGAVARVVLLLQQLNPRSGGPRARVSAENVAALLYPRLGAEWEPHLEDTKRALGVLRDRNFVDEEPDAGFRFCQADEKSFRERVRDVRPDEAKVEQVLCEKTLEVARTLRLNALSRPSGNQIEVDLTAKIRPQNFTDSGSNGQLSVRFVWAAPAQVEASHRLWLTRFADVASLIIWVLKSDGEAEEIAREIVQLETAIADHERQHGHASGELLRRENQRLDRLRNEVLEQAVTRAIQDGMLLHLGTHVSLAGTQRAPADALRERLEHAVAQVFTELDDGDVVVDKPERAVTWLPTQPLPDAFKKLQLFDATGEVLTDRPFLKSLMVFLRNRPEAGRTGKALIAAFRAIPYSWPEGAVKAGLGALLRARRIVVRLPGSAPISSEGELAQHWLATTGQFNRAVVEVTGVVLDADAVERLQALFATAFGRPGLDTLEKLEREAEAQLRESIRDAREALASVEGLGLAGVASLRSLASVLEAAMRPAHSAARLDELDKLVRGGADASVTKMTTWMDLMRAVGRLRVAGKLPVLGGIRQRVVDLYSELENPPAELAELRSAIDSEEFLMRAEQVIERDARLFTVYATEYRKRHALVFTQAEEARLSLKSNPQWERLSSTRQGGVTKSLSFCADQPDIRVSSSAAWYCASCRRRYRQLSDDLELIALRQQAAEGELGGAGAEPVNTSTVPPRIAKESGGGGTAVFELVVDTEAKLAEALTRIEARLREPGGPWRVVIKSHGGA